ncbi:class I SAM-dependent methyltransferase [Streptomyces griseoviridis]|uniref:SAM-dependent methyltransferase n=1 Tax=Streptomyces griseoviridis TaxID=45398 RepID=A0A3Q9KQH6_STRGD|nr:MULTISPECIES: class I SAM-dependent methyltransferase [Streptomyces]AZS86954.1 class I SAM-dependent methyltransferase [Streptomyces griseoviridis]MDH6702152.1 SAM-dependent methyltransferase [Streptomyces sp. MAA16]QCN86191.1 SAM-dependent methyltransferase [Streptomyces griseoviridis]
MASVHNFDHERAVWDSYAESVWKGGGAEFVPAFRWTQYQGHGPGVELLGEPASVLEIGCGTGRALAHLAGRGVRARGIDLSPVMVAAASERWADLGIVFECAEALEWLGTDTRTYDAVYSVFGAAWFSDPELLFPLVLPRLNPGGVFVFSQPPAIPGAYGRQGMYKGGFAGPARYTYRYSHPPETWRSHLLAAGFADAVAGVLPAPAVGHIGTLIVRAVAV